MIVYHATKSDFSDDIFHDRIDTKILSFFKKHLNRSTAVSEINSWRESMRYMEIVLRDNDIPGDCGVAIEYQLPQSGKRIDFILTGTGENKTEYCIIIELKQWSEATLSDKDAVVNTRVGRYFGEFTHPSYQAWSYASLLYNFNETVAEDKINLQPCAYLHNYIKDDVITHDHYKEHLAKAPVFLRGDAAKLRDFIKQYVRYGDTSKILYRIEQGKIRPSKMLTDSMVSLLQGNTEFVMIDDQKIVYETALALSQKATANKKKVLIVKGGPGTGKSVVAVNLLVELTKRGLVVQYVSKNAAPRAVYESKLTGSLKKSEISNLFKGSGSFVTTKPNTFDTLIVDEAHRLNAKSGLYSNLGENQIKELINASRCTVFFIDEDQRV
ncbi:MAG TPA: DNA/RNA helicase domain-containing protein, partial [Chitinophagaceae bacterium]|nr:DNA/RNA helicase domain-containing protein [Chitinophagaceae bacterium]